MRECANPKFQFLELALATLSIEGIATWTTAWDFITALFSDHTYAHTPSERRVDEATLCAISS